MAGPSRPPFPSAPSEPSLRRLGVSSGGGGDRPIKAQLMVALVALIILLAVPLYLWRRPSLHTSTADAGVVATAVPSAPGPAVVASVSPAVPIQTMRVRTNPLQRVRCGASRTRSTSGGTCDALPALEHALVEAVQQSADCGPKTSKEGTINYVLEVDFVHKTLHVFPGVSGDWHGPSARRATKCVERALGKPDISQIPHTHAYYALAVMATYPQGRSTSALPVQIQPALPVLPGAAAMGSTLPAGSATSMQPPEGLAPLPQ